MADDGNRIYLFDSTLRDGAQTQGVDFSVADKSAIARALDGIGIDYVEGGWPGENPTDDVFFRDAPVLERAKFTAFGMTRGPGRSVENDLGLAALLDECRWNARGELVTVSEATVKVDVGNDHHMAVAEGNGPVNALGKVLLQSYPELGDMRLVDYKVRILTPTDGTGAVTRVMIESADGRNRRWSCIGLSTNIIDASYNALQDSISYKLFRDGAMARRRRDGSAGD